MSNRWEHVQSWQMGGWREGSRGPVGLDQSSEGGSWNPVASTKALLLGGPSSCHSSTATACPLGLLQLLRTGGLGPNLSRHSFQGLQRGNSHGQPQSWSQLLPSPTCEMRGGIWGGITHSSMRRSEASPFLLYLGGRASPSKGNNER